MEKDVTLIDSSELKSLKDYTLLVYILQAVGILLPVLPFIVAVVLNYIRREDVANTWLASHFRWQIRTFWYAVLWSILGALTYFVLIGVLVLFANLVWVIYRIAKGWLYLSEAKEMYAVAPIAH